MRFIRLPYSLLGLNLGNSAVSWEATLIKVLLKNILALTCVWARDPTPGTGVRSTSATYRNVLSRLSAHVQFHRLGLGLGFRGDWMLGLRLGLSINTTVAQFEKVAQPVRTAVVRSNAVESRSQRSMMNAA